MGQDVIEEAELKAHATNGRLANGSSGAQAHDENDQTNENIFLFIPNLIGGYYDSSAMLARG
jgi:CDP-diacylglycerol--inositol 3-phosphatidyltransferase